MFAPLSRIVSVVVDVAPNAATLFVNVLYSVVVDVGLNAAIKFVDVLYSLVFVFRNFIIHVAWTPGLPHR